MFWTEERTKVLRALWAMGQTGSEIARAMGINRNSVFGKAWRIGLLGYRNPRPRTRKGSLMPFRRLARRPPMVEATEIAPPSDAAQRSFNGLSGPSYNLMDLHRSDCRWPIGDPLVPGFCYCSAPVARGSYCRNHWAIAYEPRR